MLIDYIKLANKSVQNLVPYEPGKPIEETALEYNISPESIIKLASNENPFGPSKKVTEIFNTENYKLELYPDGNAIKVKQALAKHLNISTEKLTLGNGSDELLRLIALAYASCNDEIIFSEYAFAVYSIATLSVGATPVEIKAKNWGHDLNAMANAVCSKTRIIYIANPNNPTGTWLNEDQLLKFLDKIPSNVLVVLDQAYIEYFENIDICESVRWIDKYPNLVISRTFSKSYGLAGLRIGYFVSNPQISNIINRVRPGFNINTLAQESVTVAIKDQNFVKKTCKANLEGMLYFEKELTNMQLEYIPSKANFITINVSRFGKNLFNRLLKKGIIVRPLNGYKMNEYIRVSIGKYYENMRFIESLYNLNKQ